MIANCSSVTDKAPCWPPVLSYPRLAPILTPPTFANAALDNLFNLFVCNFWPERFNLFGVAFYYVQFRIMICEKLKPLRFKLIFSMTQVTQSTNPSTMSTNTLKTKKLQLPNHVRFTSLFEKPLASLGQSALLLGTHGAVSYPDLRSAARTKHKARPVWLTYSSS